MECRTWRHVPAALTEDGEPPDHPDTTNAANACPYPPNSLCVLDPAQRRPALTRNSNKGREWLSTKRQDE